MENTQFIAFDVETASSTCPRFICQLGITIVDIDNKIVETKSFYVQPPNNYIEPILSRIHRITTDKTKDAPDFKTTWMQVKDYFEHTIVAHNASFDCSVLKENLEYYNLEIPTFSNCECTYRIFGRKLDELCAGFNIDCSNHHEAGFDAECCALFYINHLKGLTPDESLMPEVVKVARDRKKRNHTSKLTGDILVKDLSNADPDNPFYDMKTVITGTFQYERKALAIKIKEMGADINTSISNQTNIVLVGEKPGPSKIKQIKALKEKGCDIRVIQEFELEEILDKY